CLDLQKAVIVNQKLFLFLPKQNTSLSLNEDLWRPEYLNRKNHKNPLDSIKDFEKYPTSITSFQFAFKLITEYTYVEIRKLDDLPTVDCSRYSEDQLIWSISNRPATKWIHFSPDTQSISISTTYEYCNEKWKITYDLSPSIGYHPVLKLNIQETKSVETKNISSHLIIFIPVTHEMFFDEYEIRILQNEPICLIKNSKSDFEFPSKSRCLGDRVFDAIKMEVFGDSDLEVPIDSPKAMGNVLVIKIEVSKLGTNTLGYLHVNLRIYKTELTFS
ncbi:hypothetical protein HK096_005240, partial [Nowakowskiella sp. JEL0078]